MRSLYIVTYEISGDLHGDPYTNADSALNRVYEIWNEYHILPDVDQYMFEVDEDDETDPGAWVRVWTS